MLTLNDIINVNFRKSNFSGYRPEDVDQFLDQVKDSYEQLIKKNIEQKDTITRLRTENEEMVKKIEVLAERVETYREEEDGIKNALISAQKLGDASIREARHKSEIIIKDANLKAEKIIGNAQSQIEKYEKELEDAKRAVSEFRSALLEMYKQHLTLIDALPGMKPEPKAPVSAPVEDEPEQAEPEAPEAPETAVEEEPASEVVASKIEEENDPQNLEAVGFEPAAKEAAPAHDSRFESVNFEEQAAAGDPESPLDIFNKHS